MENRIFTTRSVEMGSRLAARRRTIVLILFPAFFEGRLRGFSLTFGLESDLELVVLVLTKMVNAVLAVRAIGLR